VNDGVVYLSAEKTKKRPSLEEPLVLLERELTRVQQVFQQQQTGVPPMQT
jgi:hypothetical protein